MRCPSDARASPLRVGIVDYLNSRPLAWSFLKGEAAERYEAVLMPPARIADLLAAGELDIGLVPSIELQRLRGVRVIPGLCVAATREVKSVLLVSRCEIGEIQRLALDSNSRTSAALIRILLVERYGCQPECVVSTPRLDRMLGQADAALVIGDPALQIDRTGYHALDLAAEWRALTGLPFVFALWAVREGVAADRLAEDFTASLEQGLAQIEALVREAVRELGLAPAEVRTYLTDHLSYYLGDAELEGLQEFYRRAHSMGMIPAPVPLRLVSSCGRGGDSVEYLAP